MPTVATAAVAACAFAALFVGHQFGDHIVQRHRDRLAKCTPDDVRLAAGVHPWTGWRACARHVATYTATQALALAVVSVVAPLTIVGVLAALAASAGSHVVIDRCWIVRAIVRAKQCQEHWSDSPYLIDQSLHHGMLLVAAVLAATVTSDVAAAGVGVAGAVLVATALAVEVHRARSAATRIGDPHRL